MFNIGMGELLFIAILILVVIGPERLPTLMRQLGEYTAQIRRIIRNFNQEFADELKPLHEIRNLADDLNPTKQLGNLLDPDVQRPTPKRAEPVQPKTNPMSQIAQAADGVSHDEISAATPDAPAPQQQSGNPMAQISQVMMQSNPTQSEGEAETAPSSDTPQEA